MITKTSDIPKLIFVVTLPALIVVSLALMAFYPKEQWLWEFSISWLLTIAISTVAVGKIGQKMLIIHQLNQELFDVNEELRRVVSRDRLTDVATRDFFFSQLENDPDAYGTSLMVDIDFFKKVNDTYGHLIGDKVIAHVADILKQETRPGDLVCRFGGEEFVIFLYGSALEGGHAIAERLRQAIETQPMIDEAIAIQVTVSVGGSLKEAAGNLDDAIARADEALYRAKSLGRNRTEMTPPYHPQTQVLRHSA